MRPASACRWRSNRERAGVPSDQWVMSNLRDPVSSKVAVVGLWRHSNDANIVQTAPLPGNGDSVCRLALLPHQQEPLFRRASVHLQMLRRENYLGSAVSVSADCFRPCTQGKRPGRPCRRYLTTLAGRRQRRVVGQDDAYPRLLLRIAKSCNLKIKVFLRVFRPARKSEWIEPDEGNGGQRDQRMMHPVPAITLANAGALSFLSRHGPPRFRHEIVGRRRHGREL